MWSIFWFFNCHWAFFLALDQAHQSWLQGGTFNLGACLSVLVMGCSLGLGLVAEGEGV